MKIRFYLSVFTIILFSMNGAYAQSMDIKELKVNDTIPSELLLGTPKDRTEPIKFSDIKRKLIVIDFWASYCQPCINALPKFQKLQHIFRDEVQFLIVTHEDENRVEGLLRRSEITKEIDFSIPFLVRDTILRKLFPHQVIPHEVIIDSSGIIKAITYESEITEKNIRLALYTDKINVASKNDFQANIDSIKSDEPEIWLSSLQLGGNGRGSVKHYRNNEYIKSISLEFTPINLFYKVYSYFKLGQLAPLNVKRVLVQVNDSANFKRYANRDLRPLPFFPSRFPYLHYNNRQEYDNDNTYIYKLHVPYGTADSSIFRVAMEDLNRYFPIKGKVEKRKVPVWVIRRNNKQPIKPSDGDSSRLILTNTEIGIVNKPIDDIFFLLTRFVNADPFINETGLKYPIDLVVNFKNSKLRDPKNGLVNNSPLDSEILKNTLEDKGLTMVREYREVDLLIVSD
ncbi:MULTISPECIES: TlpA family protein disulfide reductase [Olivibacter]|uniref:TlpA family protein disulfide reductase n=2 Tax=Olivibacter TaxID=376469 RepID=A0ABV6HQK8_9SPHI|nr:MULTISPECIES: TlpA disulfide reductase family protein [Olivibacter]MDX3917447.1 TlpA disulfide reductase family protein [Pseudosphingobacterium sp.]